MSASHTGTKPSPAQPRLGFLGVGLIGYRRLRSVASSGAGEVVVIADPDPAARARAARLAPGATTGDSLECVLRAEVDGVVIATPTAQHAAESVQALRHGLAVFCQKPLGCNAAEVRKIIDEARRADRLLAVDLCYRGTRAMQEIRRLVRSGAVGHVFAVDLAYHNAYGPRSPWFYDRERSGGGCVLDLGVHLLDAVLWLLDRPVVSVTSRLFRQGRPVADPARVTEDYAAARLELAGDTVVNLSCSWNLHAGRDAVIEMAFYGTEGGVAFRNVDGSFHDFTAELFDRTAIRVLAQPPDQWAGQMIMQWVQALSDGRRFDPDAETNLLTSAALDAIYHHAGK